MAKRSIFGGFRSVMALMAAFGLIIVPTLSIQGHPPADAPSSYVVTDLGTLGGLSAQAYDINDAGQVVGLAYTASSGGHAFLWQNGVMTDLGTIGGTASIAQAINQSGQIAGRSTVAPAPNLAYHAVLWENGLKTDLTPNGSGTATGINDARQVVGNLSDSSAFFWENGVMTILPHLGTAGTFASDINNAGQVVGSSSARAFVWQKNGVMTDLGVLPGDEESGAGGINNSGQIVGSSGRTDPETYEVTSHAFLYSGGTMTALAIPSTESYAGDINDWGHVVGAMRAGGGFSNFHAFIYANGLARNLNSLIPAGSGLHLVTANAINNAGQIVGLAYDSRGGNHAYLLNPVEPGTPMINIGDASIGEGHSGTRSATFTITLSNSSSASVTVSYGTANGSAMAGNDYQATSGSATFDPGQTSKTTSVLVNGDRAGEPNETFLVNLSLVSGNALIADGQAVGTILDDEPRISINDVSRNEGHNGTTLFVFTVTLSPASDLAVNLAFATADGSAKSVDDYQATSGSLAFSPGQTSKTITVQVLGDKKFEGEEVFYLNLSSAANAFIADSQGVGVVRNDDHR
jgi:probable HAF family extracellular repeat protein